MARSAGLLARARPSGLPDGGRDDSRDGRDFTRWIAEINCSEEGAETLPAGLISPASSNRPANSSAMALAIPDTSRPASASIGQVSHGCSSSTTPSSSSTPDEYQGRSRYTPSPPPVRVCRHVGASRCPRRAAANPGIFALSHVHVGTTYSTSGGSGRRDDGTSSSISGPWWVISCGSFVISGGKYSRNRVVAIAL